MTSNKRKKKSLLINPEFQRTFILFTLITSGISILIFLGGNTLFFHKFERLGAEFGIPANSAFYSFITRQKAMMNEIFLIMAAIDFVFIVVLGLIFSHRISGPLNRLEKFLLEVSPDNLHPIRTRKGDYFPELASALNQFIKKFEP